MDLGPSTRFAERWTGVERARVLALLDRLPALATSVRAPVLVAQQSAASDAGAAREFADLRARTIGGTRGQADLQVDTARTLTRLAGVRNAVIDRQVLEPHVEVLAKVLRTAGPAVGAFLSSPRGQTQVVELAHGSDARQFSRDLAVLVAAHDPASFEDQREAARRARFLHLTHASDGTFLRGRLDPLAGSALQAALDATGHRPDGDRAPEQARADALTALARHALGVPAPRGSGTREPVRAEPDAPSTDGTSTASRASAAARAGGGAAWRRSVVDDESEGDKESDVDEESEVDDGVVVATPGVAPQLSLLVPAETWYAVHRRAQQRGRAERLRSATRAGLGTPHGQGCDDVTSSTRSGTHAGEPRSSETCSSGDCGSETCSSGNCGSEPCHSGNCGSEPCHSGDCGSEPCGSEPCGLDAAEREGWECRGRRHGGQEEAHVLAPATSEDGKVVSASELAAALCDCAMTRVVMSAQGVPLDVGRTKRMFTPAQRKAVVARDRVCAWNGCSVPPGYCQVHHTAWWHRDGGRTDLANAVLLCDFHHHEVHRLDLGITRELAPAPAVDRADDVKDAPTAGTDGTAAAWGTGRAASARSDAETGSGASGTVVGYAGGASGATAGSRPQGRVERPRYTFRDRLGRTRNGPAGTMTPPRT